MPVVPVSTEIKCPDIYLAKEHKTIVNDAGKLICEAERDTFNAINELMRVFSYDKKRTSEKFKVNTCDTDPRTWVKAAITSNVIQKTYSFKSNCDLSGTFSGSFLGPYQMNLEMRNLYGFRSARMKVRMKLIQNAKGIRYQFTVQEGLLRSKDRNVNFNVKYEVNIDPLTESTKHETQDGRITISNLGERNLIISRPLLFRS